MLATGRVKPVHLLEVTDLHVTFGKRPRRTVHAVQGINLVLDPGECIAIVGESGSGKTTLANAIAGLIKPTRGTIRIDGEVLGVLKGHERRELHRTYQMVFQDPSDSLNPRKTIGASVGQPLATFGVGKHAQRRERVLATLNNVGLAPAAAFIDRYPHELSGGQRQRASIGRAVILGPKLLIADEAVSALDVSVQAGVLSLLQDLRTRTGLGMLFISHDLAVVRSLATRVLVMFRGRIIESGATEELFTHPRHPYTVALLHASPRLENASRPRVAERGVPPIATAQSDTTDFGGCPYYFRCGMRIERCAIERPVLREVEPGHRSACFRASSVRIEPAVRSP